MKVKELDRTVNVAWSPPAYHPILLAAGTAAQQLDASFNTSAALEIYALNLAEPGLDMDLKVSVPSQHRFHKVGWGSSGPGVIVGGCDNGKIQMYNVSKLLAGEEGLITIQDRHTGPVRSLDFNPFQTNLLASGASESEIYIWDLNNTSTPMTPGAKPQPYEDVVWLAWNKQVQHILASTFPTRCIVWDLRKNEPIIKLTDSTSRVRWKVVAWHPDVATQLCLASEDDSNPVVQLWDLRFATSPLKTLQGHSRGVLTLAWCSRDPDLLISSGKDSRILCWNPNSNEQNGEVVCEITNTQQVIFEVSWCPRNPSLIASSSCDGHTSIYSLTGSQNQVQTSTKIADSFPGMEEMTGSEPPPPQNPMTVDLRKPPKWLRRPVGASFAFGGILVNFGQEGVVIKRVMTEDDVFTRARNLDEALNTGRIVELCQGRADPVWSYIEASFDPNPRIAIRTLLGYDEQSMKKSMGKPANLRQNLDIDGLADHMSHLNQNVMDGATPEFGDNPGSISAFGSNQNGISAFDGISMKQTPEKQISPFSISTGNDVNGSICKALLLGGIEEAVEVCLKEKRMADAIILAMAAGPELLAKTQLKYFQETDGYLSHLIEAIVTEDWKKVVSSCELSSWKEALTGILTYSRDEDLPSLCEELGKRLEAEGGPENQASSEICYIASGNMAPLIEKRTSDGCLSPESIQELVELVLVGGQASSSRGLPPLREDSSSLLLAAYAELLASQGALEMALRYISTVNHEDVEDLKDRLYYALGHKTLHQQQPQQAPQQLQQTQYSRKTSGSFQNGLVGGQIPQMPPKPPTPGAGYQSTGYNRVPPQPGPPPPSTPAAMTRSTPSPHQAQGKKIYIVDPSVQGGYRNTTSTAFSQGSVPMYQGPPTFGPPGSYSGSSNFPSSLSSSYNPPGAPSYPSAPAPSVPTFPPSHQPSYASPPIQKQGFGTTPGSVAPPSVPPAMPTPSTFTPHGQQAPATFAPSAQHTPSTFAPPSSQPAVSSFPPPSQQTTTAFLPPAQQTSSTFVPPQQSSSTFVPHAQQPATTFPPLGSQPPSTFSPPPQPPSSTFPTSQQQPVPFTTPPSFSKPPSNIGSQLSSQAGNRGAAPGWNDPPAISGPPRNQPKTEVVHQNPITHPLFGSAPQQNFQPQQNFSPQQQNFPPPQQNFPPPQQNFPPPQQNFPPVQQNIPAMTQQQQFQPQSFSQPPPQPAQQALSGLNDAYSNVREEKPPLPQQYAHMQAVLHDLRSHATTAANNPQLKRKLEEVGRKLETLYDALRDNKLSAETINGLEQMVTLLETGEYRGALDLHTRMVSGSDFSQIASFMPGLKGLIQSALQLGVYLQ